ncbi:MAG: hypothetical protein DIU71_18395 [Proteobacteria bacterium]|nr:MAG: hypothetical protein DIU71_18395 [Pseudomonadota bacterium]
MHGPGHGPASSAAGPGRPAPPIVDVVILTRDAGLLGTLRAATGPMHAVWPAESAEAAVDLLVGGRCGILVVDLELLSADAAGLLTRLGAQFPELVTIAAGRRRRDAGVRGLVADGRLYRFLHKPVSPVRASDCLAAATHRYGELRNLEPLALATTPRVAPPRRSRSRYAALGALLAGIGAAFALWFGLR